MYDRLGDLVSRAAQFYTQSAFRPVPLLNMGSSYFIGQRIANEDFQQDRYSLNLPFSSIYRKTARNPCRIVVSYSVEQGALWIWRFLCRYHGGVANVAEASYNVASLYEAQKPKENDIYL
ncbi:hypothetical protein TNCV_4022991 [Trichonephila clavipes]|nr:hypothetical protein TNCV_4022991 [Trichonephila clavipes]